MRKSIKERIYTVASCMFLCIAGFSVIFPVVFLVANTFMTNSDLILYYEKATYKTFHFVPDHFTLEQYIHAFFYSYKYLRSFIFSFFITVPTVIIQLIISILAGYGFAKFSFPFKKSLFLIYVILMMTPFQVLQAPQYILMYRIGLIDNIFSIILTSVFYPIGVCIMSQSIKKIPDEIIDASKIDGANSLQTLIYIVVHSSINGIAAVCFLCFIEQWTLVEQAVVFIKSNTNMPLSVIIQNIASISNPSAFVFAVIFMIPPIFVGSLCHEYLLNDIVKSELLEI